MSCVSCLEKRLEKAVRLIERLLEMTPSDIEYPTDTKIRRDAREYVRIYRKEQAKQKGRKS